MQTVKSPVGLSETIRAETFESSLHTRVIGRAGASETSFWRLVHVEQGHAELMDGTELFSLEAPCILMQPWRRDTRLRIGAGAVGSHVFLNGSVLAGAIGYKPESPELRFMTERRAYVSLSDAPVLERITAQAMAVILGEAGREAAAAHTVVEAALRIILIHLWRAQGTPQGNESSVSTTRRLMGQFNNLVEVHFRQRWTVQQYADVLGITTDRLNDICKRARGRTPRQVIAARTGMEARLLLENSLYSLDQIANQLGFPGTAQFNRFFKSVHGVPPGYFRRQQSARGDPGMNERLELFEWP